MENNKQFIEHLVSEESRLVKMEADIENLAKQMESLKTDVKDLVDAWRTATGVLSFIKWLAGIGGAIVALIAYIKGYK